MTKTILACLCIAAMALPVTSALADDDRELSKSKTSKNYSDKDHKKDKKKSKPDDYHDEHEQAANKGKKHGWVNGMPPGQAKKSGEGKVKHKEHDHDYDREGYRSGGAERNTHYDRNQPPATSEEILTDMAKDAAARSAGAAPGSAEEALIYIGTDVILERTNR